MLRPFLWNSVIVYVDDVIIFSRSLNNHLRHLQEVLQRLMKSGLTLQVSKCHFAYASIKALGHRVSRLGLATDDDKIEAVRNMELPRTLSDLETALGFFNYYRQFVRGFAYITLPLEDMKTRLLKGVPVKGRPRKKHASKTILDLDDACKEAWEALKHALTSAPP